MKRVTRLVISLQNGLDRETKSHKRHQYRSKNNSEKSYESWIN